jgi:outer membrane protein assembly factor BamB
VYALKVADGALVWRKSVDASAYGRCQAANVTGGSDVEIFAPGERKISCIPADGGAALWTFSNLYDREASGTATAGTGATTLKDSTKAWAVNAFLRLGGGSLNASVRFTSGAASGQSKLITANGGDGITLTTAAFSPAPAAGDTYVIDPKYGSDTVFQHAGVLVNEGGTYYLYATSFDNHVYKLAAATGALQWKFATLENIEPYPLVISVAGNLRCIVGSVDGTVRSLNAATGAVVWTASTGAVDAFMWAADLDSDGALELIISGRNGRMMVLDAATGTIEHESTQSRAWGYGEVNAASVPVLLASETYPRIFSASDDGTLWCRDRQGNTLWQLLLAPIMCNSSPLAHDLLGTGALAILQGDMRGTLHAVDAATGRRLGVLYTKGEIEGVPYLGDMDGDGKTELVLTTTDGYVEAWRLTHGAPLATTYLPGPSQHLGRQG